MYARPLKCRVVETRWVTPSVFVLRFKPSRKFSYLPGQFLSVVVPVLAGRTTKRCYSFATSPDEARASGVYELCVRLVPQGLGSNYLAGLKPGDEFRAHAPYGGFTFKPGLPGRNVVFLCTSTGIAPFRSMLGSRSFWESEPGRVTVVVGVRDEREILYDRDLRRLGVEVVYAVSRAGKEWKGFRGRVTDFLRSLPSDWAWHETDFYLCGNGEMVREVNEILRGGHNVSPRSIHQENFSPPQAPAPRPWTVAEEAPESESLLVPLSVKQPA